MIVIEMISHKKKKRRGKKKKKGRKIDISETKRRNQTSLDETYVWYRASINNSTGA